jgi:hypothetical protein
MKMNAVHICVLNSRLTPLKDVEELVKSLRGWVEAAQLYTVTLDSYYEKTPEERDWLSAVEEQLKQHMPLEYKDGVHLIAEQGGFMGEDIFVFEGHLVTTLQVRHLECGQNQVLNWNRLYCVPCAREIMKEEIKRPSATSR